MTTRRHEDRRLITGDGRYVADLDIAIRQIGAVADLHVLCELRIAVRWQVDQ